MSSKLTLVYLCSDARDVHCHSNLEHSTHVILEHSLSFSMYVHVLVFCGSSLKLISKILTSLYGNTTVLLYMKNFKKNLTKLKGRGGTRNGTGGLRWYTEVEKQEYD